MSGLAQGVVRRKGVALGGDVRGGTEGVRKLVNQVLHVVQADPTGRRNPLLRARAQLTNDLVSLSLSSKMGEKDRQGGRSYDQCQVRQREKSSSEFTKNPCL